MGSDFPVEIPVIENPFAPGRALLTTQNPNNGVPTLPEPSDDGARYYTIQRVNGNGANGKGDGTAGAHKHTIEESDKVKKSSIHRHFLKEEKERRKSMVRSFYFYFYFLFMHDSMIYLSLEARPQGGMTSRVELPLEGDPKSAARHEPSELHSISPRQYP